MILISPLTNWPRNWPRNSGKRKKNRVSELHEWLESIFKGCFNQFHLWMGFDFEPISERPRPARPRNCNHRGWRLTKSLGIWMLSWWYPLKWLVYEGKSHLEMDDLGVPPLHGTFSIWFFVQSEAPLLAKSLNRSKKLLNTIIYGCIRDMFKSHTPKCMPLKIAYPFVGPKKSRVQRNSSGVCSFVETQAIWSGPVNVHLKNMGKSRNSQFRRQFQVLTLKKNCILQSFRGVLPIKSTETATNFRFARSRPETRRRHRMKDHPAN